MILHFIHMQEL